MNSKLIRAAIGSTAAAVLSAGLAQETSAQDYLYVALQGEAKVAVVDMSSLEEVARLDLTEMGFTDNAKPHHIAVEPDGSHWYLSLIGENQVLKLDRNNRIVAQTAFEVPGLMALDHTTGMLYVGRSMSAVNAPARIGEFQTSDMDVEEVDVFFPRPHALAVAPNAGKGYSASLSTNQMGVIDLETYDVELVQVDGPPHTLLQFAVSPDERTLVVTTEMTGHVMFYDLSDPAMPVLTRTSTVGTRPWHPVFSADGSQVFLGTKGDSEVLAVNTATGEVDWRISHPAINNPHGAAISPDGRYLFVSSNGPGGMQMDMGMGDSDHASHHPAGDEDHEMGDDHDMGEMAEAAETGTIVVIDVSTAEVVTVLEMGENTTGVGARR